VILSNQQNNIYRFCLMAGSPPASISASVYSPTGELLADIDIVSPDVGSVVLASPGGGSGEAVLTLDGEDEEEVLISISPGSIARVGAGIHGSHDAVCVGQSGLQFMVTGLPVQASEALTIWGPEIEIPINGSIFGGLTGQGYRLDITVDGSTISEWLVVAKWRISGELSAREYVDNHPEMVGRLSFLESRKDWIRLVRKAIDSAERRLLASHVNPAAVYSPASLRSVVVESLHLLLAPSNVPASWSGRADEWQSDAGRRFKRACDEFVASGFLDKNGDGLPSTSEKSSRIGTVRLRQ